LVTRRGIDSGSLLHYVKIRLASVTFMLRTTLCLQRNPGDGKNGLDRD